MKNNASDDCHGVGRVAWQLAGASSACYTTTMYSRNRIHRLQAKGDRLYQRLKARLEPRHKGEIVAIEVESGQYVVGKDELDVALEAVKKFPGRRFSFFRVGYPTVHKLRLGRCSTAA